MKKKKPSWLSTAFLLHAFTIVCSIFAGVKETIDPNISIIVTSFLTFSFSACNAYVKRTPSPKDDEILKKTEEIAKKSEVI